MQEVGVLSKRNNCFDDRILFSDLPPKCRVDGYNFFSSNYTDGQLTMIFERLRCRLRRERNERLLRVYEG